MTPEDRYIELQVARQARYDAAVADDPDGVDRYEDKAASEHNTDFSCRRKEV